MDKLLTLEQVSEALNMPVRSLRQWRHDGVGPRSAKVGKRVMYREKDVAEYIRGLFGETA